MEDPAARRRGVAFDDGVGEVSGTWTAGRPASPQPGVLVPIMVDHPEDAIEKIPSRDGGIVQPIGADAPEITARSRDPGGM